MRDIKELEYEILKELQEQGLVIGYDLRSVILAILKVVKEEIEESISSKS